MDYDARMERRAYPSDVRDDAAAVGIRLEVVKFTDAKLAGLHFLTFATLMLKRIVALILQSP